MSNTIGTRIRTEREKSDLSQKALATHAGLCVATVNRIETGAHEPRLPTLKAIAAVLGVDIGWLAR